MEQKSQYRILTADDKKELRLAIKMALEYIYPGCTITEGKNGEELLSHTKNNQYDLIVSDYNMPKISGLEAVLRLRKEGNLTPALIITGNILDLEEQLRSLKPVNFDYLSKPFEFKELKAKANALLSLNQQLTSQ